MSKPKVLLIGWDAADWKIIWPLIQKGQMPALKKLMNRGVYGNMSTMNPPYSPMLWSTVATGKTPDKHGVLGFVEVAPNMKGVRPVTVHSRKARAIWNILHNQGFKSNIVGWWPSFPAEPINGNVVTDKFQKVNKTTVRNVFEKGTFFPEALVNDIGDLRMFPREITEAHFLPCFPRAKEIDQDKSKGLESFAKILSSNTSIHAAATYLQRETEWDFMAVYYDLIDHFCHAYMKFHPPKMNRVPQALYDIYKDGVVSAYRIQDMMLERNLELIDKDTTVIVMSDHGYESGHRRIYEMPNYQAAPALEHRQFGIFVAAGPLIKENEKIFGLGLIDVAPTLLHMFNLPVGNDMDGKVALDIFKTYKKPEYIESWENLDGDFGLHHKDNEEDYQTDSDTLQQLIDLGYIDKPDEKIGIAVLKTQCDLKHNLARVYLGKKNISKAKQILLELINDNYPVFTESDFEGDRNKKLKDSGITVGDFVIDKVPYYLDLISVSFAEDNYEQAKFYLKAIKDSKLRFAVNLYFSEAKILLNEGRISEALTVMEEAIKDKPNSELFYQTGKIYRRLNKFNLARSAFERAISLEPDRAKLHQAIAETLIRQGSYEEAAEHAFTAIELVKYFAAAHYTLGEALEKLGDRENAKIAYKTALSLKSKSFDYAERALENLELNKANNLTFSDKATHSFKENQIVVVSGLPRSGTSLMMQMLDKGGVKTLTDENRIADESNPKGYYEYKPVMSIFKDNSWLHLAKNKSVKIVAPLLRHLDSKFRYKVIFMKRDLTEIIKSQQIMIGKNPDILPTKLYEAYIEELNRVEIWKKKEPGVELIYIDYTDAVKNPDAIVDKVEAFIGKNLNKSEMVKCVDKSLYRNRVS